jgi:hypothetical protein
MAILIVLTSGFIYYLLQSRTHMFAQLQDTPAQKSQLSTFSDGKPAEFGRLPNENSVQSDQSKNLLTIEENKPFQEREVANGSALTNLSAGNQLKPTESKAESDQKSQNPAGKVGSAILPTQKEAAFPPKTIKEESVTLGASPSPAAGDTLNAAQNAPMIESKATVRQGTPQPFDEDMGSAQKPRTQAASIPAADNVRVVRAVATNEIKNKNPLELGNSFPWSTEKVYIWSMIECKQPPSSIRHTYYFEGQKVNDIELKVKSPQWRTWSYKTLLKKRWIGQWKVDITSAEGELLQSLFFEVN